MPINNCLMLKMFLGLTFILGNFVSLKAADKNYFYVKVSGHAKTASNEGLQEALELNFSPENREKLRKALEDYSRSVDPNHEQIEERRRAMHESIQARFLATDNDNDGTIDRQEATESLPQIARHFSQVDTNQDNVISLIELENAQNKILERRKAAEAAMEAEKLEELEAASNDKPKTKQAYSTSRKRAL